MRVRSFVFPKPVRGTGIPEVQAVEAGKFPVEITLKEAVEWYWRYRELDVSSVLLGASRSGTAVDATADAAATGVKEKHLIYPANLGRQYQIDIETAGTDDQIVSVEYFIPIEIGFSGTYEYWRGKPSNAIQPSLLVQWTATYDSLGGFAYPVVTMTSDVDSVDPLSFGYVTMNATVFGETVAMAGTAVYDGATQELDISGASLTIEPSKWFEYKKDDGSLPVWEETSGVQILDPLTASVP